MGRLLNGDELDFSQVPPLRSKCRESPSSVQMLSGDLYADDNVPSQLTYDIPSATDMYRSPVRERIPLSPSSRTT